MSFTLAILTMMFNPTHQAKDQPYKPCIDLSSPLLDDARREILTKLTTEYSDCFVNPENNKLGLTKVASHKIELKPDAKSVHKNPYRQPHHVNEEMDKIVQTQLKQGLIEETYSGEWASPALLVRKSSGAYRLVIDYRALNSQTIPLNLRIPRIDDIFDQVGNNRPQYFSIADISSAFHQLPLDPQSQDYTAFMTNKGKFCYKTMPQGLRNASSSFQSVMDIMLKGIQHHYILVYIDDLLVFSPDFDTHVVHLRNLFD